MFATIRRHQSWLLTTVAAITIISFIGWNWNRNTGSAGQGGGGPGNFGVVAGRAITRDELLATMRSVQLGYFLQHGEWLPEQSAEVDRSVEYQAYVQLFMNAKMKELGIDVPTEAAAQYFRRMFPADTTVAGLEAKYLKPKGMDASDLNRFLSFEVGRDQLMMLVGLYGYLVTPQEAEQEYRFNYQDVSTSMVFYSASNFLANVPANVDSVAQYYTNHLASYRVPEKVQVEYVKFNVTNYLAAAEKAMTNVDAMVDEVVRQRGTNLFPGAKTPEESHEAIKKQAFREHALVDARRDAYQFATELEAVQPRTVDSLRTLAVKKGLAVETPAPFDRENGPQDSTTPMQFVRAAFSRTPDEPFAPPVTTEDGSYVLVQKQLLPSYIPPLGTILGRVTVDYRHAEALKLAEQAAIKLYSTYMTNALPAGKTFAAVCAEAKVTMMPVPPFSRATQSLTNQIEDFADLHQLQSAAFSTPPGMASQPQHGHDGAFLLFVERHLPLNEVKVKADLPEFTARIRRARMNDAFNEWLTLQVRHDPAFNELLRRKQEDAQPKSIRPASS